MVTIGSKQHIRQCQQSSSQQQCQKKTEANTTHLIKPYEHSNQPPMFFVPIENPRFSCYTYTKKTWVSPTLRLSHCQALALPLPRISNAVSPRREILYKSYAHSKVCMRVQYTQRGRPRCRIFLGSNLQNLTVEDYVRKRPFLL